MVAKEGIGLILTAVVLSIALFGLSVLARNRTSLIFASFSAVVALFLLYFFRDPERKIPIEPNLIVAPSDGRVLAIDTVSRNDFLGAGGKRVSVFLSPLDVHVIRSPAEAEINYVTYHKGSFKAAYADQASLENENLELGLISNESRMILRQIAGFLARRIVCHVKQFDRVSRGARLGIIRFGSRVELILPENVELKISPREKVKAGETIIGVLR